MWHAIYTKTKKEDSVASRLQNIGIEVLNPRLKSRKFKSSRLIEVIEPLFPCYFFANFDTDKYSHLIKYTRGVRYIVGKSNPLPVSDDVISAIKGNMDSNNIVIVRPGRFNQGDRVLIRDGLFRDFHGIFEKDIKGPERVMILLETIHCRLELDSCCLSMAWENRRIRIRLRKSVFLLNLSSDLNLMTNMPDNVLPDSMCRTCPNGHEWR